MIGRPVIKVELPADAVPGDRVAFTCSSPVEVDKGDGLTAFVARGVVVTFEYVQVVGIEPPTYAWQVAT